MRAGRSVGLFFLIPAVAAVAPLLALPAITTGYGLAGWASIAIGLSIGMGCATILELGWSVIGPQLIAASSDEERRSLYWRSMSSKYLAASVMVPVGALLTFFLTSSYRWDATLVAAASTLATLGSSWVFVGLGRPLAILVTDTLPRVVLLIAASVGIFAGGPLFLYPAALALAAIVSAFAGPALAGIRPVPPARYFRGAGADIRAQLVIIVGRIAGTGYTSFTVALVAVWAPGAVAQFAAIERVLRMGAAVLGGFPSRFQSWLGAAPPGELRARVRFTILANALFGGVSGLAFAVGAPLAVQILFVGQIEVTPMLAWGAAGVLALICVSRGLGLALIALRAPGAITASIICAACVGVPSLLIAPVWWGVAGAIAAELLAELVGVVVQSVLLIRRAKNR
jgi:hypothetical protein